MKIAQFSTFGKPSDVISCVEVEAPSDPIADEVVVEIDAFPINPADLLTLSGKYASRPALPATLGAEGVGHVTQVGPDVRDLSVGDEVLPLGRDNWVQQKKEKQSTLIKLPTIDTLQAAMLKVNPATAWCMLNDYVDLTEGDMLIQNAANSGVGMNLIKLAEMRGIRTINIVRRPELIPLLKDQCGAFEVLVSNPGIVDEVAKVVGNNALKLACDAIGGEATRLLSKCLQPGGTVVNYGLLSGQSCRIDPHELVFREITLTGFWLAKKLVKTPNQTLLDMYAQLGTLIENGTLFVPVERTYDIAHIADAVEHAQKSGRAGKILVLPNA